MYETLLSTAYNEGVEVVELPFLKMKGLYCDRTIGLKKEMPTVEKACVLAEELGHYHTSAGDILNQDCLINRKQELKARRWGYERLVPLERILQAFDARVRSRQELIEYLEVTEEFLVAALKHHAVKHGPLYKKGNYTICFEPLMVFREIVGFG